MRKLLLPLLPLLFVAPAAFGQTLVAETTANNGGSPGWGMFFDLSATGSAVTITSLTTASTATAGGAFSVELFTRTGSGLGGPVASGAGSSSAGWTSIGTASATQGGTTSGISLTIDTPDFTIANGSTVGVAMVFTGAGPRYLGTGSPALSTFTDGPLKLVTGDARTVPFTTTGSFFTSRALTGSISYTSSAVPEPATMAALGLGALGLLRRRRKG